jgi:hypothetical protein
MRQHPQLAMICSSISYLRPPGYPPAIMKIGRHRLPAAKEEQIPIAARIFAIADVWDALTSDRSYRPAWNKEKAVEHIRFQASACFDPYVVDRFLHLLHEEGLL